MKKTVDGLYLKFLEFEIKTLKWAEKALLEGDLDKANALKLEIEKYFLQTSEKMKGFYPEKIRQLQRLESKQYTGLYKLLPVYILEMFERFNQDDILDIELDLEIIKDFTMHSYKEYINKRQTASGQ